MSGKAAPQKPAKRRGAGRRRLRLATTAAFVLVIVVGYALHVGIGNACGIGFLDVALVCPLGSLSALVASKTFIPQAVASLAAFAAFALIAGRAFCGWLCPTPVLQRWLPGVNLSKADRAKRRRAKLAKKAAWERKLAQEEAAEQGRELSSEELDAIVARRLGDRAGAQALTEQERADIAREMDEVKRAAGCGKSRGVKWGTPHTLLLATLVTTAVFGFPVFCAVCPVGLTFAFALLVMRLFAYGELTWALVAFPAVVAVELALLPRWCSDLCPLGALHSLAAAGNRTLRPHVERATCLQTTHGENACHRCADACPQGIDLHDIARGRTTLNDCTKCGACADACPTGSVSFPFLVREGRSGRREE